MRALAHRPSLRDERGMTIVELLVTMVIGLIILGAATMITIGAASHNNEVANRVTASQRGRLAMELMQRDLRSQVCTTDTPFPVSTAKTDTVTFTSDLSDGSTPPYKHTYTFNAAARTITDSSIKGSVATPITFTATPSVSTLATDVELNGTNPIFRYYAYPTTAPGAGTALEPTVELVPPAGASLPSVDLGRIARIDVNFVTTGETLPTRNIKVEQLDTVFVRLSDPNDLSAFGPSCS
jgi:prepilin-type N-terminal cleavage/methylation domain-containing protein